MMGAIFFFMLSERCVKAEERCAAARLGAAKLETHRPPSRSTEAAERSLFQNDAEREAAHMRRTHKCHQFKEV